MAPSNFTPNERLLRKRLAARLRQRRCRERKRELIVSGIVATHTGVTEVTNKSDSSISIEGTASADNSTGYSSTKSSPASSPSKVGPVYLNIQNLPQRQPAPQGGYSWTYPVMPPIPRNKAAHTLQPSHQPNYHHHSQHLPSVQSHPNGYYAPPPHHHHHQQYHQTTLPPMMYSHHPHPYMNHGPHPSQMYPPQIRGNGSHGPPPYPMAAYGPPPPIPSIPQHQDPTHGTYQSSTESGPGDVSRTVSRSPSDASMNSGKAAEAAAAADKTKHDINKAVSQIDTGSGIVSADEMVNTNAYSHKNPKNSHKTSNNEKKLMSTEKAAVAAMLAMKTSSDESDGDSISAVTNKSMSRTQHKHRQPSPLQQQEQHAVSSRSLVASV